MSSIIAEACCRCLERVFPLLTFGFDERFWDHRHEVPPGEWQLLALVVGRQHYSVLSLVGKGPAVLTRVVHYDSMAASASPHDAAWVKKRLFHAM